MGKLIKSVFISSAVKELESERKFLKERIPNIYNQYIHFEPFLCEYNETFKITEKNYADDDSVNICLKKVEECEYYVLIIKEKYNYKRKYGCSVTELEYKKAMELHKPIIVFVFNKTTPTRYANGFIKRIKDKWIHFVENTEEIIQILDGKLNEFDSSKFIGENPPEGKHFPKHETVEKTWTIKNAGNVAWLNRYMIQTEGTIGLDPEKKKIEIPPIYPGDTFIFRVNYKCGSEGDYYSLWKMVDENNKPYFQTDYKGLWVNASVR